jgi:asparagine synthase (glutamine-hydrolysing)
LVGGDRALARGLFSPEYVRGLLAEHVGGQRDHADRLWSLMNLEIWHRVFIDGELPQTPLPQLAEYSSNPLRPN